MCALVQEYLTAEGFSLKAVHDGEQGLQQALTGDYSLVVLDVMLPGINGFEVLRRIRSMSKIPVLLLTARGEDVDRIVGLEIGADDYLPKPFNTARAGGANPRDPAPHQAGQGGGRSAGSAQRWRRGTRSSDTKRAAGGAAGRSDFGGIQSAGSSAARGGASGDAGALGECRAQPQVHAFDRSIDMHVSRCGGVGRFRRGRRSHQTIREWDTCLRAATKAKK